MSDDNQNQRPSYSMGGSISANATGGTMGAGASLGGGYGGQASPSSGGTPASAAAEPVIKDVSDQTFVRDVIEASKTRPVVVDFWAPWCGPCKQLGPVIEKVVTEAGGAVTLCKMDVERYPAISQQMGIQSIPAVVAFIDGKPADAFMGAKPENEVRAFIDKVAASAPNPESDAMGQALDEAEKRLAEKDYGGAAELYGAVLGRHPGNLDALAGMGHCFLAVGELDRVQSLIDPVPEEHRKDGPMAALIKALDLAKQAEDLGDLAPLEAAVEANPKDHQARLDYAIALNAAGRREEAGEQLVAIVRADRAWNDEAARKQLLTFFETWGNSDPATLAGRRALSSVLFS